MTRLRPIAAPWAAGSLLLCAALAGCTAGADDGSSSGAASGSGQRTELRVLAASSLTGVFDTLARDFERQHPGVHVTPVYDSSATLALQVSEGAPADVLATADQATMQTVVAAGDASAPTVFASNRLVMVTPPDNPAGLRSFGDLDGGQVTWVACVASAPCGKVARALEVRDGIRTSPSSLEVDVKAVLTKVTSGEADAGLVYATDAVAAGDQVHVLPVPGSGSARNDYAIAVTDQSDAPDLAAAWVALVESAHGQQVLADAGFGPGH